MGDLRMALKSSPDRRFAHMKYVALLSALVIVCLLAAPVLAAHNGNCNGDCIRDCTTDCPHGSDGSQDGSGHQHGNGQNGNQDGPQDGTGPLRDGSCQS